MKKQPLTSYRWLKFDKRFFLIPIFFSLFVVFKWFSSTNIDLNQCVHGIYSAAGFQQIDISARVGLFYKSLTLLFVSYLIFHLIITFISQKWPASHNLLKILNFLSFGGIAILFFILVQTSNQAPLYFLISLFIVVIYFFIFSRIFNKKTLEFTVHWFLYLICFSLSVLFFVSEVFLILNQSPIAIDFYVLFTLVFIVSIHLIHITGLFNYSLKKTLFILKPLFFLPLITILSDEIYLILNQRGIHFISPDKWYFVLLFILLSGIAFQIIKSRSKQNFIPVKKQLKFIFPVILINITVFTYYTPIYNAPAEMFELANPANAIMRLFQFGEIPILEALSSHLLSEQFWSWLYILFNGYDGSLSFMNYHFFNAFVYIVISYFFLKKLTKNSIFAFSVVVFFPFLPVLIYQTLSIALISTFFIYNLFQKYNFTTLIYLFVWTAFVIIWRIDAGFANLVAVFLSLVLYLLVNYQPKLIISYLKAFLYVSLPIVLVITLLTIIFNIPIFNNIAKALAYFGADQAHGLPKLTFNANRLFYYQYFIFPIAILSIFIALAIKFFKHPETTKKFAPLTLFFLIIFYFANAKRGLVRHGFTTGQDMFLSSFAFLIFIISIVYFTKVKKTKALLLFFVAATLLINNFKYPDSKGYKSLFEVFSTSFEQNRHLEASSVKIARTNYPEGFAQKNYIELKKFLNENFDSEATFIDFSNSPMLYFYTKRQVPSYFNQYMQNTLTTELQTKNLNYLTNFNIPVVVYAYHPKSWYDHTDGVANEIRYGKIRQYIFTHYSPFTLMSNHQIWIKKGCIPVNKDYKKIPENIIHKPQHYKIQHLAWVLGKCKDFRKMSVIQTWSNNADSLKLKLPLNKQKEHYIRLNISNPLTEEKNINFEYFKEKEPAGKFSFIANKGNHEYIIPVSAQYNWYSLEVKKLFFSANKKINIEKIELIAIR